MPSLTPYEVQTIKEPLPYLGYPWVMAEQVYDTANSTIISREFNTLAFESPTIQYLPGEPPNTTTNYGAYYSIQRKLVETKWLGQLLITSDTADPLSALNNFQGWLTHTVDWYVQNWYHDAPAFIITWQPEYNTATPPQLTGYYVFKVVAADTGANVIPPTQQAPSTTSISITLSSQACGAFIQASTGSAAVYNTVGTTGTTNPISNALTILFNPRLRFTKPAAVFTPGVGGLSGTLTDTSSCTLVIRGLPADGTIIFGDNISTQQIVMHPPNTSAPTLIKPPGLPGLVDLFPTLASTIGTPISERLTPWQIS